MKSSDLIKKERLDYGGFGEVFLCYHKTLGHVVQKTVYTGPPRNEWVSACLHYARSDEMRDHAGQDRIKLQTKADDMARRAQKKKKSQDKFKATLSRVGTWCFPFHKSRSTDDQIRNIKLRKWQTPTRPRKGKVLPLMCHVWNMQINQH